MLQMDYNIMNVVFNEGLVINDDVEITHAPGSEVSVPKRVDFVSTDYFRAKSVFVSHTLRSGQRIECEGDVVVLGDVNDGAEIIAGGSIAVMGTLRGLAHAGGNGTERCGGCGKCAAAKATAYQRENCRISR